MNAEIIAVGTELLLGQIVNTNAQFLSQELAALGIGLYCQTVVGDNPARLTEAVRQALQRAEVIILTGGLGPTADDLTRETVAEAMGRPLQFDEQIWQVISARMQRFGRQIPENNKRQATVPAGATSLPNPNGTAPGIAIEADGQLVVLLPGPPREMQPMFLAEVRPRLVQMTGQGVILSRSLRVIGVGESALDELISDLVAAQSNPTIALYAKLGEVEVRITAKAKEEPDARALIAPIEVEIRQRLGQAVYGVDQETLAGALGRLLVSRGWKLALAESCTGGLIGSMITAVPGSSDYFDRGYVTYSDEAKQQMLGIPAEVLATHGAVSAECAASMAAGARSASGADFGIAVTGIAGPAGGTPSKPVGTVFVALDSPIGRQVERLSLTGDRTAVQERTAKTAINLARLLLLTTEGR